MAVVDGLIDALPRVERVHDPRVVAKALHPGRIRGAALRIHAAAISQPGSAESTTRHQLTAARELHSRERRLVADGLHALFRHGAVLDEALGPDASAAPALARWLGWLVLSGAEVETAAQAWTDADGTGAPRFSALLDLPAFLSPHLSALEPSAAIALVGNLPEHVATALHSSLGAMVGPFLAASNERAPLTLRTNRARITRVALLTQLGAEGLSCRPTPIAADGILVDAPANIRALPAFREGLCELQDEASQLVAEIVEPTGMVVDFCAGAGGKTLALAALAPDARIMATDTRDAPLEELRRRTRRARTRGLQSTRISPEGELPDRVERLRGRADRVLVDAPCSGTGVLRRHPANRLRWTAAHFEALPQQQLAILTRAAALVAPGGRLIYATCSVLDRENSEVVARFLDTTPGFTQRTLADLLGVRAATLGDGIALRTTPHTRSTDGFYAAVLERIR